jgi:glycosyltransferase involved in cell wall biosynthesis
MRGGGETYLSNLIEGLSGLGVECSVVTGKPLTQSNTELFSVPVPRSRVFGLGHLYLRPYLNKSSSLLESVPSRLLSGVSSVSYDSSFATRVGAILNSLRPNVLHLHDSFATLYPALVLKQSHELPLVVTLHGRFWSPLLRKVDAIVAFGEPAGLLREKGLTPVEIPPTVDRQRFAAAYRNREADEKSLKLLYVGRLIPAKNVSCLIKALKLLVKEGWSDVRLKIVGDGPLRPELEALSSSLELNRLITFEGALKQNMIQAAYCDSDIFVLPSSYDAYPIAVMEAMSSGLTVVVSNMVFNDFLAEGDNCLRFDATSPKSLARTLSRLRRDQSLLKGLAQGALKTSTSFPSWESVARKHLDLYDALIGSRP